MVNILQYWTILVNIRRYLTIFDKILSISNNIIDFRPTLAQPYCFKLFRVHNFWDDITWTSYRTSFLSLKKHKKSINNCLPSADLLWWTSRKEYLYSERPWLGQFWSIYCILKNPCNECSSFNLSPSNTLRNILQKHLEQQWIAH